MTVRERKREECGESRVKSSCWLIGICIHHEEHILERQRYRGKEKRKVFFKKATAMYQAEDFSHRTQQIRERNSALQSFERNYQLKSAGLFILFWILYTFLKITASLRYNSHAIQITHLMFTIQWVLVLSQCSSTVSHHSQFRTLSSLPNPQLLIDLILKFKAMQGKDGISWKLKGLIRKH